jgi:hypothetical protein
MRQVIEPTTYLQALDTETDFVLRRAMERLREGLFDPLAVRLLTAHEDQLKQAVEEGFRAIETGQPPHLCICGAYGRGKSHSLMYIEAYARKAHFVTSLINLDPRETPFHRFQSVYRALMNTLRFPDTDDAFARVWRTWAEGQLRGRDDPEAGTADLLPAAMPHRFRSVLAAMAQPTISLTERQQKAKKHARYRPRQFPSLLSRALAGEPVPVDRLRPALKYRQVAFYRDASLACRGDDVYVQMIHSLAGLFRQLGYRGWVLLFDEGEAVAQVPVPMRRKSYRLLHQLLYPDASATGLYPIFGFTDDFFQQVEDEDYHRMQQQGEEESPYFERNYAEAWRALTRYELEDLSHKDWETLSEMLILLHACAYRWQPSEAQARRALQTRLAEQPAHETRYKLKALVDELDLLYQEQVF